MPEKAETERAVKVFCLHCFWINVPVFLEGSLLSCFLVEPSFMVKKKIVTCVCVILVPSTMTVSILSRTPHSRWFLEISIFLFDFNFLMVIVEPPSSFSESLSVSGSAWEEKSNWIFAQIMRNAAHPHIQRLKILQQIQTILLAADLNF